MRYCLLSIYCLLYFTSHSQADLNMVTRRDSLVIINKDAAKGFYFDYLLFIPKNTRLHQKTWLLVEPNNTGQINDSMEIHRESAIHLASVSSVGNNVSTELKIPLLVPVFPRPASQPLVYTHALDRDVILDTTPELKRLDRQLLAMIADGRKRLKSMDIEVDEKFLMSGFSASGSFTNRFSFIHPEKIKALAIGGFNGELMAPLEQVNNMSVDYPIGIHDFKKLFGHSFNKAAYQAIPQFIYLGMLDDNDAVQYDDAYDDKERKIINENLGANVQERYLACQKIYRDAKINATFRSYEKVGHWTTSAMNLDVILFFKSQIRE